MAAPAPPMPGAVATPDAPLPAIVEPAPIVNATFAATCPGMASEANSNTIDAINSSLLTNGVLGILFTALFLVLRVYMKQYQLRLHLPFVTIKPPPMPTRGIKALFGWIPVVLSTSDAFVLRSAGLDALVLQKSFGVCVQIFVPMSILACSILLPVQSNQQFLASNAANDRSFASITMANINSRSPVMWLHFFLAASFIAYSFLLIEWHYRQYVALRQHYLHGGDDPNYWRDLHLAEADGVLSGAGAAGGGGGGGGEGGDGKKGAGGAHGLSTGGARIFDVVAEARYRAVLDALDDQHRERARALKPWERAMTWLTSWTGTEDVQRLRLHRAGEAAKRASMKIGGTFNVARALMMGELGGGGRTGGEAAAGTTEDATAADADAAGGPPAGKLSASAVLRDRLFGRVQARVPATLAATAEDEEGGPHDATTTGGAGAVPRAPPPTAGGVSAGGFDEERPPLPPQGRGRATTDDGDGGGPPSLRLPPQSAGGASSAAGGAATTDGGAGISTAGDDDDLLFGRPVTTQMDYAQREMQGEDIGSRAAPKWWSSIDTVATQDGRLRRLTAGEAEALSEGGAAAVMLAKPSVRYRKTINTRLRTGRRVAVNAQQYAVLVTNVPEPCYPEVVEEQHRARRALLEAAQAAELEARRRAKAAKAGGGGGLRWRGGGGAGKPARTDAHADPLPGGGLLPTSTSSAAAATVDGIYGSGGSRGDSGTLGASGTGTGTGTGAPSPASPRGVRPDGFLGAGWCGYKPGHAAASHEAVRSWVKGEEWLARHAAAGGETYGFFADPFDAAELAREEEEAAARHRLEAGGGDEASAAAAVAPWRPRDQRPGRPPSSSSAAAARRETDDLRGAIRQAGADPVVRDVVHEQQLRDGEADPEAHCAAVLERQRSIKAGAARGWEAARRAARDGRLKALSIAPHYSLVAAVFSTLFPDDFDRVVPVFNHRAVDMALRAWDRTLGQLEAAQHRLRLTGARPTLVPPGSKRVPLSVLEAAEAATGGRATEVALVRAAEAEAAAEAGGKGAGSNGGGLGGKPPPQKQPPPPPQKQRGRGKNPHRLVPAQVDAIDWLAADLRRLEQVVVDERARALREGFTPSWFVLFRSQKAAAIAASCNIHPLNRAGFQVHPAPGPEEVNWYALWFTHEQRSLRGWITVPCIVFLVLVPVSLVAAAITQVNAAFCTSSLSWRWYCCSRNFVARGAKSLLTGFVPTLLVLLWQGMAMPRLVFMCAQSEARHFSLSLLDRRMGEIYFLWACFNFFLGGILGGAALFTTNLLRISQTFSSGDAMGVLNSLSAAIPASAKFFVLYMINRALMTLPLRFLITQPGVWQAWLRLCDVFATPSERQLFLNYSIRSPRYGPEYGNMLLIALVGWAFALVCPVVLPFCAVWFVGMWLFWRYQLIYNYARKYESGGRMWPFFVSRMLICMAVMVLLTSLVLITKAALAQGVLLAVFGLIALLQFSRRLHLRYAAGIDRMPLLLADAAPKARVPSTCYVPPPLLDGGLAWHPEWNRVWEWFGMPSHSF